VKRSPIRRRPAGNHQSAEWWEQRLYLLLVRSGGLCEGLTPWCLAPHGQVVGMPREALSVQHRRAQGSGGTSLADTHSLANHLILDGSGTTGCHGWVETHGREEARDRGLWVPHSSRRGVPVPVEEYWLRLGSGRRVFLDPANPAYVQHPDPYGPGVPDDDISVDVDF
jgi:hypothetical protein